MHHLPVSKDAPINYKLSTVNLTIIFLECLVVVLAVAQLSVDEADELYGCLEAEFLVLGTEDVLMEYCDRKECLRCRIGYEYLKR